MKSNEQVGEGLALGFINGGEIDDREEEGGRSREEERREAVEVGEGRIEDEVAADDFEERGE